MSSWQRRRYGREADIYGTSPYTDARGNIKYAPDKYKHYRKKVVQIPDRSSRAEVPGQMAIRVTKIMVPPDLPGVGLFSVVRMDMAGAETWWDVVAPPDEHIATRKWDRHWSLVLRMRPDKYKFEKVPA